MMHYIFGYGMMNYTYFPFFNGIMLLFWLLLVFGLAILILRVLRGNKHLDLGADSNYLKILKERYA